MMTLDNDPIGSVRWDKVDPFDVSNDVDMDVCQAIVDALSQDVDFIRGIGLDSNIEKYAQYKHRDKYNKMYVTRSMMRIINVYRKKKKMRINNLDELKVAATMMEANIYASI